eukprot:gene9566-biopygen12235
MCREKRPRPRPVRVRSASVYSNSIVRPASGPRPVRVRCRFSLRVPVRARPKVQYVVKQNCHNVLLRMLPLNGEARWTGGGPRAKRGGAACVCMAKRSARSHAIALPTGTCGVRYPHNNPACSRVGSAATLKNKTRRARNSCSLPKWSPPHPHAPASPAQLAVPPSPHPHILPSRGLPECGDSGMSWRHRRRLKAPGIT